MERSLRGWRALACVVTLLTTGAGARPSAQAPRVDAILATAAAYIADYERAVTAVVAQEDYTQRVPTNTMNKARLLRSDMIFIADAASGWVEFRDVYEVDSRKVRDRDDRVAQLFLKPNPDARAQAARIVDESARFNLNPDARVFNRTLNIPMTALRFLRKDNQWRSRFEVVREERTAAGPVVVVRFRETAIPRLIGSREEAAANGLFWIEPQSGAVVKTELRLSTTAIVATITVTYERVLEGKLWLPAVMDELYNMSDIVSGHATYSNFRIFKVDVSTDLPK